MAAGVDVIQGGVHCRLLGILDHIRHCPLPAFGLAAIATVTATSSRPARGSSSRGWPPTDGDGSFPNSTRPRCTARYPPTGPSRGSLGRSLEAANKCSCQTLRVGRAGMTAQQLTARSARHSDPTASTAPALGALDAARHLVQPLPGRLGLSQVFRRLRRRPPVERYHPLGEAVHVPLGVVLLGEIPHHDDAGRCLRPRRLVLEGHALPYGRRYSEPRPADLDGLPASDLRQRVDVDRKELGRPFEAAAGFLHPGDGGVDPVRSLLLFEAAFFGFGISRRSSTRRSRSTRTCRRTRGVPCPVSTSIGVDDTPPPSSSIFLALFLGLAAPLLHVVVHVLVHVSSAFFPWLFPIPPSSSASCASCASSLHFCSSRLALTSSSRYRSAVPIPAMPSSSTRKASPRGNITLSLSSGLDTAMTSPAATRAAASRSAPPYESCRSRRPTPHGQRLTWASSPARSVTLANLAWYPYVGSSRVGFSGSGIISIRTLGFRARRSATPAEER
mmetsp:Transcript_3209/g.7325  ORF Transcript_3209/g.7325 Transcript_3209/m.7325 type:complete len:502 (-) Transcript_3209:190-1695(-)